MDLRVLLGDLNVENSELMFKSIACDFAPTFQDL